MSSGNPSSGAWSRGLWAWVVGLTAGGVAGIPMVFFGYIFVSGGRIGVGCGGGIGILFAFYLALAVIWGIDWLVAALGAFLFWRRSRWGPLLLIPLNLFNLYVLGGSDVVPPGQVIWAAVVVALTAVPAIAAVLLVRPLLTRGRMRVRLVEFVVLGTMAAAVLWACAGGLAGDVASTMQAARPPVVAAGCGGTPS
jgi:hypothetical protein